MRLVFDTNTYFENPLYNQFQLLTYHTRDVIGISHFAIAVLYSEKNKIKINK